SSLDFAGSLLVRYILRTKKKEFQNGSSESSRILGHGGCDTSTDAIKSNGANQSHRNDIHVCLHARSKFCPLRFQDCDGGLRQSWNSRRRARPHEGPRVHNEGITGRGSTITRRSRFESSVVQQSVGSDGAK